MIKNSDLENNLSLSILNCCPLLFLSLCNPFHWSFINWFCKLIFCVVEHHTIFLKFQLIKSFISASLFHHTLVNINMALCSSKLFYNKFSTAKLSTWQTQVKKKKSVFFFFSFFSLFLSWYNTAVSFNTVFLCLCLMLTCFLKYLLKLDFVQIHVTLPSNTLVFL